MSTETVVPGNETNVSFFKVAYFLRSPLVTVVYVLLTLVTCIFFNQK